MTQNIRNNEMHEINLFGVFTDVQINDFRLCIKQLIRLKLNKAEDR